MPRVASAIVACAAVLLVSSAPAIRGAPAERAPSEHVYARPGGTPLKAYVFAPDPPGAASRPAIVLFLGGGWTMGEAAWACPRARKFAERGVVAVAAQYRLSDQKGVTPLEAMADARAVIRWVREQADALGIDPKRVAAYGWSAGGHLATSAAIFGKDGTREIRGERPDALVLVSPAVSLVSDRWVQRLLGDRGSARDVSPDEHVRRGMPPTLVLQGDVDTVTPLAGAKRFCERMRAAGNACELQVYEGFGHLFTPAGVRDDGMPDPDPATAAAASKRADQFLKSLGFLD